MYSQQGAQLWPLPKRAGVRILSELTNAHALFALNQISLGVWCSPRSPRRMGQGTKKMNVISGCQEFLQASQLKLKNAWLWHTCNGQRRIRNSYFCYYLQCISKKFLFLNEATKSRLVIFHMQTWRECHQKERYFAHHYMYCCVHYTLHLCGVEL